MCQLHQLGDHLGGRELLVGVARHQLVDPLGEQAPAHLVALRDGRALGEQFRLERLDRQVRLARLLRLLHPVGSERVESGQWQSGLGVDVHDAGAGGGVHDQLTEDPFDLLGNLLAAADPVLRVEFEHPRSRLLDEPHLMFDRLEISGARRERPGAGQFGRQLPELIGERAGVGVVVDPVSRRRRRPQTGDQRQQRGAPPLHLVGPGLLLPLLTDDLPHLRQELVDDLGGLRGGLADDLLPRLGAVPRELLQRRGEIVGERGVGDQQPVLFSLIGAVDAGEGLHEQRALERPVHVERVQGGGVEAGEHHVLDDHDLELVGRVLHPRPYRGGRAGPAQVFGDVLGFAGRGGVDDLDPALVVGVAVPVGPECDHLLVQPGGDRAGRAHDHRLAWHTEEGLHRVAADLPVGDEVVRECAEPVG